MSQSDNDQSEGNVYLLDNDQRNVYLLDNDQSEGNVYLLDNDQRNVYLLDNDQSEGNVYLLVGLIVLGLRLVIILLGLVGNTLSMMVWSRPNLKSSSSVVLVALAVADTLVIVCGLWSNIQDDYYKLKQYNGDESMYDPIALNYIFTYYFQWSEMLSRIIYKTAVIASMYLTVLITVERFICICHPFRFKEWCSYSRTLIFVGITILFAILYNISHFWEFLVVPRNVLEEEPITMHVAGRTFFVGPLITIYERERTELLYNPLYVDVYVIWMFIFIDYLLPLTCIITLNTITYIKLKRIDKERRAMSYSRSDENKLTKMVIYVVVEFLVCTSFTGYIALDLMFSSDGGYTVSLFFLLRQVRDTFHALNSSVNFITYVSYWPPFRRTFIQMFCCHKKHNEPTPAINGNPNQTSNTRVTPV